MSLWTHVKKIVGYLLSFGNINASLLLLLLLLLRLLNLLLLLFLLY